MSTNQNHDVISYLSLDKVHLFPYGIVDRRTNYTCGLAQGVKSFALAVFQTAADCLILTIYVRRYPDAMSDLIPPSKSTSIIRIIYSVGIKRNPSFSEIANIYYIKSNVWEHDTRWQWRIMERSQTSTKTLTLFCYEDLIYTWCAN